MLSIINKQKFKNYIQTVLHVKGNYKGGILEMAFVFDHFLEEDYVKELSADAASALKQTDEIFRNVRLNVVDWYTDDNISSMVSSLAHVQMGKPFEDWKQVNSNKNIEILCEYLKKFQARSKVIVLFTDGINVNDDERLKNALKPFLSKKLIIFDRDNILYRSLDK